MVALGQNVTLTALLWSQLSALTPWAVLAVVGVLAYGVLRACWLALDTEPAL
jgi:hypothetical protein